MKETFYFKSAILSIDRKHMAIPYDCFTLVIRVTSIEKTYPGGWRKFQSDYNFNAIRDGDSTDGEIFGRSFMNSMEIHMMRESLTKRGLKNFVDFCAFDSFVDIAKDVTPHCPWLECGDEPQTVRLVKPPQPPILNLGAIEDALNAPMIRREFLAAYGVQAPMQSAKITDILLTVLNQPIQENPLVQNCTPQAIFKAASLAIGSNSRSWVSFRKGESQLAKLLLDYDPICVAQAMQSGALEIDTLMPFFPGFTGRADATAVLKWAQLLSQPGFDLNKNLKAVSDTLDGLFSDRSVNLPGRLPLAHVKMPLVALLFSISSYTKHAGIAAHHVKFPGMGATLATEFFRNLGWSGFKPDRHIQRLLAAWVPSHVQANEENARALLQVIGLTGKEAVGFLNYSMMGMAMTPAGVPYSTADAMVWALGAYVVKKGGTSTRVFVTPD